jgi:hypothetical protein
LHDSTLEDFGMNRESTGRQERLPIPVCGMCVSVSGSGLG